MYRFVDSFVIYCGSTIVRDLVIEQNIGSAIINSKLSCNEFMHIRFIENKDGHGMAVCIFSDISKVLVTFSRLSKPNDEYLEYKFFESIYDDE